MSFQITRHTFEADNTTILVRDICSAKATASGFLAFMVLAILVVVLILGVTKGWICLVVLVGGGGGVYFIPGGGTLTVTTMHGQHEIEGSLWECERMREEITKAMNEIHEAEAK